MASCPGSSPLTRGKRRRPDFRRAPARLIPAHAGKTDGGIQTAVARKAHPRSRGENARSRGSTVVSSGSSPLTRGKPSRSQRNAGQIRLIPAHAGKTWSIRCMAFCGPAHPRSRGENRSRSPPPPHRPGSSPLTRGKLSRTGSIRRCLGLIPAHAGKTIWHVVSSPSFPAHPRSRGENGPGIPSISRPPGSSPLTRGKRSARAGLRSWRRLIPAHAGKTCGW